MLSKIVSDNIKRLRKNRNWTQEQLAEKAGCSFFSIAGVEHQRWSLHQIEILSDIANIFYITVDELIKEERKND